MKAYNDLVTAYNSKSAEKLARVAEQHMATYTAVSGLECGFGQLPGANKRCRLLSTHR